MSKRKFLLLFVLFLYALHAQIGLCTQMSYATLAMKAKARSPTIIDGFAPIDYQGTS